MVHIKLTPVTGPQRLQYKYDKIGDDDILIGYANFQDHFTDPSFDTDRIYDMRNFTQLSVKIKNTHTSDACAYQIEECYKNFADITELTNGDFKVNASHTNKTLTSQQYSATYIALFVQGISAVRVRLRAPSAYGTAEVYTKAT